MNRHKLDATTLRDSGYSYGMISKELGVSRSTLSNWFRDRPYKPNQEALSRLAYGRSQFGQRKKEARLNEVQKYLKIGRDEIGVVSKRDLWMVGLGLWLGEGSKTGEQLRLANSDPTIIALWLRWLREVCGLNDDNIAVRIHAYSDIDEAGAVKFWQQLTGLPQSSFYKTQFDTRVSKQAAKTGKLPHGTLHVSVKSNKDPLKGVQFYRKMMGWISGVLN